MNKHMATLLLAATLALPAQAEPEITFQYQHPISGTESLRSSALAARWYGVLAAVDDYAQRYSVTAEDLALDFASWELLVWSLPMTPVATLPRSAPAVPCDTSPDTGLCHALTIQVWLKSFKDDDIATRMRAFNGFTKVQLQAEAKRLKARYGALRKQGKTDAIALVLATNEANQRLFKNRQQHSTLAMALSREAQNVTNDRVSDDIAMEAQNRYHNVMQYLFDIQEATSFAVDDREHEGKRQLKLKADWDRRDVMAHLRQLVTGGHPLDGEELSYFTRSDRHAKDRNAFKCPSMKHTGLDTHREYIADFRRGRVTAHKVRHSANAYWFAAAAGQYDTQGFCFDADEQYRPYWSEHGEALHCLPDQYDCTLVGTLEALDTVSMVVAITVNGQRKERELIGFKYLAERDWYELNVGWPSVGVELPKDIEIGSIEAEMILLHNGIRL